MRYFQEETREYLTRDDLVAIHTQEPEPKPVVISASYKQQELIEAYPGMKFLTKNPDPQLVDEWYTILQDERSKLGNWGGGETTILPARTKYSLQRIYVKLISYYKHSGVPKQRVFFTVASGDNPVCYHSGSVTKGLTKGWNQVSFTTSGVDKVLSLHLNKVSALKSDSF